MTIRAVDRDGADRNRGRNWSEQEQEKEEEKEESCGPARGNQWQAPLKAALERAQQMWQCHKFKALFPAASGSRGPGIDNSNWILKTAAQESRTTALGGTRHSPAWLPPFLASTPTPGQSRVLLCRPGTKTSKFRSPFARCRCCLHCVIQNAPEISSAAIQKI